MQCSDAIENKTLLQQSRRSHNCTGKYWDPTYEHRKATAAKDSRTFDDVSRMKLGPNNVPSQGETNRVVPKRPSLRSSQIYRQGQSAQQEIDTRWYRRFHSTFRCPDSFKEIVEE